MWNILLHLKKGICFMLFVGSQKHLSVIMHFHYFSGQRLRSGRKHPQKTKLPESVVGSSAISKSDSGHFQCVTDVAHAVLNNLPELCQGGYAVHCRMPLFAETNVVNLRRTRRKCPTPGSGLRGGYVLTREDSEEKVKAKEEGERWPGLVSPD